MIIRRRSTLSSTEDREGKIARLMGITATEVREFAYQYLLDEIIRKEARSRKKRKFITTTAAAIVFLVGIGLAVAYLVYSHRM